MRNMHSDLLSMDEMDIKNHNTLMYGTSAALFFVAAVAFMFCVLDFRLALAVMFLLVISTYLVVTAGSGNRLMTALTILGCVALPTIMVMLIMSASPGAPFRM